MLPCLEHRAGLLSTFSLAVPRTSRKVCFRSPHARCLCYLSLTLRLAAPAAPQPSSPPARLCPQSSIRFRWRQRVKPVVKTFALGMGCAQSRLSQLAGCTLLGRQSSKTAKMKLTDPCPERCEVAALRSLANVMAESHVAWFSIVRLEGCFECGFRFTVSGWVSRQTAS